MPSPTAGAWSRAATAPARRCGSSACPGRRRTGRTRRGSAAGGVRLGDEELEAGDSVRITGEEGLELVAGGTAEVLIWELSA
ncbi:hypothetical protein [Streptomyces sp. NPDC058092]|uniref:pirin family protein n=1 Tax=Streptomyces sp. NPDC058092 TaxID=3346336 RepID=UPI0036E40FA0